MALVDLNKLKEKARNATSKENLAAAKEKAIAVATKEAEKFAASEKGQ